ncbi:MAG: IS1634 family transposase [Chromatiales bacterium]|nr:IS1634 family transposase [Chromatiales bacterium]
MDALWAGQAVLEQRLAAVLLPRFPDALDLLFYDLTTVRIAGDGTVEGDLRRYGHSKDVRGADRQVAVGVVQTATGLPLTHEVFEGNVGEVTTVQGIIERLGQRFRLRRVVFVADRGMLSLDTLDLLEALTLPGADLGVHHRRPRSPLHPSHRRPGHPPSPPGQDQPPQPGGKRGGRAAGEWPAAGGGATIPNGPGRSAASAPSGFGKCWCSRAPWKPSSRLRMPG